MADRAKPPKGGKAPGLLIVIGSGGLPKPPKSGRKPKPPKKK